MAGCEEIAVLSPGATSVAIPVSGQNYLAFARDGFEFVQGPSLSSKSIERIFKALTQIQSAGRETTGIEAGAIKLPESWNSLTDDPEALVLLSRYVNHLVESAREKVTDSAITANTSARIDIRWNEEGWVPFGS